MYRYHELAFPALHLRLLLSEGFEFYSSRNDYALAYYDPDSWQELPAKRWVPPGVNAACNKKELLEKLLDTLKASGGVERDKALKDAMRSCMGERFVVSDNVVPDKINKEEIQSSISKIFEMANISQPGSNIEYGMVYLLLRIILGGLLFAGSEKPLSGVSKLAALNGSFHSSDLVMDEDLINKILNEVGANSASLDAYLRNVEPFLAHLCLSSDPGERQRFQKISDCFSKYFHNIMDVEVTLEQFEARLRPRPALLQPETESTLVERLINELSASLQNVTVKLQYPRIYLREKVGGREMATPLDMAAQGLRELLSLLTALIGRPGSVVFLDEPASNMHPTLLSQFLMDLLGHGNCSKELGRNQIVVITHSPVVAKIFMEADVGASEKNPAEEGLSDISDLSIIRVDINEGDGASGIQRLSPSLYDEHHEKLDKEYKGRIDPKVTFVKDLRVVDPRVLFARGVVLCEGPADHAFLREVLRLSNNSEKWNDLLRSNIELVGMNGKNNLTVYDRVLRYLDIPYVAVLDFDTLCEVLLYKKEDESKDHPLYNACKCKELLVLTPSKLNELNESGKLSRYRYVLLLDGDSVPEQLDCNDDSVLKSVLLENCNKCIDKDNNCKKKSEKCELEGFLKGLGMKLSYKDKNGETISCTEYGKLKPEIVPECVEMAPQDVREKIEQMGNILFELIEANVLRRSTNATAS